MGERKKNWFRRHKILTGLLALVLVFIAVKASGGSSGTTATPPANSAAAPAEAGMNTPVLDGQFQFTVTKVDCGHASVGTSPLDSTAQGQFCLISVAVKNIGESAQALDASAQKAFNPSGQEYSADAKASMFLKDSNTFYNQINPGNTVKGTVVFDIPKDAKLASLELHDSVLSGGVKVKL